MPRTVGRKGIFIWCKKTLESKVLQVLNSFLFKRFKKGGRKAGHFFKLAGEVGYTAVIQEI